MAAASRISATLRAKIVRQVRTFNSFDLANDPYAEHEPLDG